ncbi:oligosaccharide repeat unit polymerase [Deinococcus sp. D7000]|nr:oligosaccharide repeat unit polymerase [Deinococcus sp. D7000]
MIYLTLTATALILLTNLTSLCKDIRHPANLYLISWLIMLILFTLPLINYIEVSTETYVYILLGIFIFNFFSITGGLFSLKLPKFINNVHIINNTLLISLGYLGLAAALLYLQSKFGLINVIQNPGLVRSQDDGGSGLLGLLIFAPSIVFTIIIIQYSFIRIMPLSSIIFLIIVLSYMLIQPQRTTLINTLVWTVFSTYYFNRDIQRVTVQLIRKYLPRLILLSVVFLTFFIVVSERTGKVRSVNRIEYAINQEISLPNSFIQPYIYLTANIPALGLIVDDNLKANQLASFKPEITVIFFRRALQILLPPDSSSSLTSNAEFAEVPFLFNTYTWLYEPLKDYGFFGSMIYISVFGLLCGLIWRLRDRSISIFTCFVYGWAATACIFSILTNKFSSIYFNYSIIMVILIYMISYLAQSMRTTYRLNKKGES